MDSFQPGCITVPWVGLGIVEFYVALIGLFTWWWTQPLFVCQQNSWIDFIGIRMWHANQFYHVPLSVRSSYIKLITLAQGLNGAYDKIFLFIPVYRLVWSNFYSLIAVHFKVVKNDSFYFFLVCYVHILYVLKKRWVSSMLGHIFTSFTLALALRVFLMMSLEFRRLIGFILWPFYVLNPTRNANSEMIR